MIAVDTNVLIGANQTFDQSTQRAARASRKSLTGGFFLDSQSIVLGKTYQHLTQQFTAETIYNYVDPPVTVSVFVRGFGGDFGTLSIEKYPNVVFINGDSGLDSRGRPKHICGQGE